MFPGRQSMSRHAGSRRGSIRCQRGHFLCHRRILEALDWLRLVDPEVGGFNGFNAGCWNLLGPFSTTKMYQIWDDLPWLPGSWRHQSFLASKGSVVCLRSFRKILERYIRSVLIHAWKVPVAILERKRESTSCSRIGARDVRKRKFFFFKEPIIH